FAQQLLWRAAVESEPFLSGRTMIIAGHFHQRTIVYPIGQAAKSGQLLTNWVCQMAVPDDAPPQEDWNKRISKDKVYAAFGKWRFPWLDLPALIEQTPSIYEFPLVDRDPVETWTLGRVTLIGDAAHPMQPIGSQAGSQPAPMAVLALRDPPLHLVIAGHRRPSTRPLRRRSRSFSALAKIREDAQTGSVGGTCPIPPGTCRYPKPCAFHSGVGDKPGNRRLLCAKLFGEEFLAFSRLSGRFV